MYLSDFEYLHSFWRYSPPTFEVARNRAKFGKFRPLKFFGEKPFEILNRDYKIEHSFDHGAKFRGDRPTKRGNLAT